MQSLRCESLALRQCQTYMQHMQLKLLAFAQIREQLGFSERIVECGPDETARDVISRVAPELAISSVRVALDCEYRSWDTRVGGSHELALIPPVSGG